MLVYFELFNKFVEGGRDNGKSKVGIGVVIIYGV